MDKLKFNLLDALIIVAIVLVLALGIFILTGNSGSTSNVAPPQTTTAVIDLQITKVDKAICDKFLQGLENGDTVWLGVKERIECKYADVKITPAEEVSYDSHSGKSIIAKSSLLYDITVTMETPATVTDSAINASGTAVRVGQATAVRGKGYAGYGYIIGITAAN